MKKFGRKVLPLVLSLLLLLPLCQSPVYAAEGDFNIQDGLLLKYTGSGGDVVIPDGVTDIAEGAFSYCLGLNSVTIPNGVTRIRSCAFWHCENLTNVIIPGSVTTIKDSAFAYCNALTNIVIPDGVVEIGSKAFAYCRNLASISIPASVTKFGYAAFKETPWLKNMGEFASANGILLQYQGTGGDVVIPSGITGIAGEAFYECEGLTSVVIPDGVISIGEMAFQSCTNLTQVTIPDGVTTIEKCAFQWCTNLESITIPDSVTEIGYQAFLDCMNMKTATISNNVKTIWSGTFAGCSSLSSITIPESVTGLTPGGGQHGAFDGCSSLTSIIIPDSVTVVGKLTFAGCSGLTNITIPNSVTEIGQGAFSGCTNLTNVIIPDTVTVIPSYAFSDCTGLSSIVIPNSVTSIEGNAFSGCTNLKNVTLPSALTDVGDYAFEGTPWLAEKKETQGDFVIVGTNLAEYRGTGEIAVIPSGVKTISQWVFRDHNELKQVIIPDGVTELDYGVFEGCLNLESVTIPASVTQLGDVYGHRNIFYYLDGDDVYGYASRVLPKLTLYVTAGSYAEDYAKRLNIPYTVGGITGHQATLTAAPNRSKVQVNGQVIAFDAYTINENNYFKLRDLAMALKGTGKQFEVTWDGQNNAINLVSGQGYTVVGGELMLGDGTEKTCTPNTSTIYLNGQLIQLTAYTINNNNYFKLRDVGQTFDFDVTWDGAKNMILIDTENSYTPD